MDGLVCSIMGYFTRLLYIHSPDGLAKIRRDLLKYPTIPHTKLSNKIYLSFNFTQQSTNNVKKEYKYLTYLYFRGTVWPVLIKFLE